MTRGQAFGGGIVILAVAWVHSLVSGIIVTIAIIGICWVAVRVHPRVRHTGLGSCHGTGESRNMFFPWRFRRCGRCNSGRLVSPLAARFGSDPVREEAARAKDGRKAAREQHRWR